MPLFFTDLKSSRLYPALVVDDFISHHRLKSLLYFIQALFLFFVILILLGGIGRHVDQFKTFSASAAAIKYQVLGLTVILFGLIVCGWIIRAYLRSWYYFDYIVGNRYRPEDLYTFSVGRILYRCRDGDVVSALLRSDFGWQLLARASISSEKVKNYLTRRSTTVSALAFSPEQVLTVRELVTFLLKEDTSWRDFFAEEGLRSAEVLMIVDYLVRQIEERELSVRWWRPENLKQIGSLGRGWAYGATWQLDRYAENLLEHSAAQSRPYALMVRGQEVGQIENILTRRTETNVLLVGADRESQLEVVWSLAQLMRAGRVSSRLEHKRLLFFTAGRFLAACKSRMEVERSLLELVSEAVAAGDVVLVIDDLPALFQGGEVLGANLPSLLDSYLASGRLSLIALVASDSFHRDLEKRSDVMSRFETVLVRDLTVDEVLAALLESIAVIERRAEVFFTYQALRAIVKTAGYFSGDATLLSRANDFIQEVVSWSARRGVPLITEEDVFTYVRGKTNLPVGALSGDEQARLASLEKELSAKVIGQERAVKAVAGALKRARAGTVNPHRPLGSFLFLGPTGVGKTETAKALATAYFGSEEKLLRLDMSEYQGEDGLMRLTGSFAHGKPGVLTVLIRENNFGVVLLDEFEKSHSAVKNLFLQVLDEGIFADMDGKTVNARSIIFIATSNAGAEEIWRLVGSGFDPAEKKDELINQIIGAGVFKPELLNRFDDIVVFHPLGPAELAKIARLMLGKLASRLAEKGITLEVTDELATYVSRRGANQLFGARPMNRFIQDTIEQAVANGLVDGSIARGARLNFVLATDDSLPPTIKVS